MAELTSIAGNPIAFLQGAGAIGKGQGTSAQVLPPFRPDSGLNEVARGKSLRAQDESVVVNRRVDQNLVRQRQDIIDAEQKKLDDELANRRALDAARLRQEQTGPNSTQAVNARAATIQFLSDLTVRQNDRADRGQQFLAEQISAQGRAEKAIQDAAFNPTLPRGSLVDIQA